MDAESLAVAGIILLLVFASLSSTVAFSSPLEVTKNISRKVMIVPGKGVVYSETFVSITVEGRGVFSLADATFVNGVDRVEFTGDKPERYFVDGGFVKVYWENMRVDGRKVINYKIVEEEPFINISLKVYFDGKPVEGVSYRDGFSLVEGQVPRYVDYVLHIDTNAVYNGSRLPQTLILMLTVNSAYLGVENSSLKPQFVTEMGEEVTYNWMTALDEPFTFNLTLRVKGTDPWGEVQLPPLVVMSTLDTSSVLAGLEEAMDSLDISGNLTSVMPDDSLEDFPAKVKNMSLFFDVMGTRLANLSRMLYNTSMQLYVASENLKKASRYALKAAGQIESSTAQTGVELSRVRRIVDRLYSIMDGLDRVLAKLPYVPDNVKGSVRKTKSELGSLRKLLSKVGSMQAEAKRAASNLRSLGKYLGEASQNMELLGDMLLNVSVSLNETSAMVSSLSERFGELGDELSVLVELSEKIRSLNETMSEFEERREALRTAYNVYLLQRPVAIVGGERVNGSILYDVESTTLAALKIKEKRDLKSLYSPEGTRSREKRKGGFNPVLAACIVGLAGSFGSMMLIRRRRVKVSVEDIEKLEKICRVLGGEGVAD